MTGAVDTVIRGPQAFTLAHAALKAMEQLKVWPTPTNFELWLHAVGEPHGALSQEIARLVKSGEALTESVCEELAAAFLPKAKLNEHIFDTGDQLKRELDSVSQAIRTARRSSESYGSALADASRELRNDVPPPQIKKLVTTLSGATQRMEQENGALEKRLAESTAEVERLRDHLEEVRREAMTDALTLLANRKHFDECLEACCAEADRARTPLTLAVLDIDHFKRFNDTWGHQTGDQVIRYVASVIGRNAKEPRIAARYGGEEFAMVFPSERGPEVARALEAMRVEISSRMLKRRSTEEDLGAVTISSGFAERGFGESPASLVERADEALYESKRSGRNRVSAAPARPQAA